jgi:5-methylcytosine-specific restriction endonuclease McrA
LAYKHSDCPNPYTRPPPPYWLRHGRVIEYAEYNLRISYTYWTKLYWATPPWLPEEMIKQIERIYLSAGPDDHVDHIVPLKNELVCGLHVPWNLQVLPAKVNMSKSNRWWPDHPYENLELAL